MNSMRLPMITTRAFSTAALCAVLTLAAALPEQAQAHAVVTESSLRTTPIPVGKATEVILYFNSGIELALSRVYLVSAGDVYQPVEINNGKKPGEMLIHLPALAEGDYAIKYKVFAADGHLTEDVLRFHVAPKR
ncbi:copper resistance protein CopC [Candidatus Methylospira mobilis]|uniref:copper resistance CopC family protein n=1 Tax=Candidatus Methylospira mobilis TaxID=1808979 RepID=UPI0028ED8752|nr:copper resistance protein CopC [Candidatus Methylospira mobilis]WNV05693.1 copper resistance protein CopC [Candidatus Methylospira mobilis]